LSRILALVRADFRAGFSLTGIDLGKVADVRELRAALTAAVYGTSYGMVIVEEELMAGLDEVERAAFSEVVVPLIMEVPGAMTWQEGGEPPAEDYVARLIRRAVGYQLNIKL
jgi:vacuolar-type H+-ATPase subunit F/Vma7